MDSTLIWAILPLAILSIGLELFALIDLIRRDPRRVQGNNKWLWAAVIIFFNLLGSIVYLTVGRTEGDIY